MDSPHQVETDSHWLALHCMDNRLGSYLLQRHAGYRYQGMHCIDSTLTVPKSIGNAMFPFAISPQPPLCLCCGVHRRCPVSGLQNICTLRNMSMIIIDEGLRCGSLCLLSACILCVTWSFPRGGARSGCSDLNAVHLLASFRNLQAKLGSCYNHVHRPSESSMAIQWI